MSPPNQREVGISPKVDTGIQKEKEKEKDRKKVAREMGNQEKARAKDPRTDVGSVADPTMHPIAPKASPKERAKQDPHTGLWKKKWNGKHGVKVQKCDHYQDYRLLKTKSPQ